MLAVSSNKRLKRYLVFWGPEFCPMGGWDDFRESYDELKDAQRVCNKVNRNSARWAHIVDLYKGIVVHR